MQAIARFRTFALGASIAVTLLAVPAMAQFTRVTTFAGNSKNDKLFKEPYDVVVQASGELLVSDSKNNRILRVSTTGVVTVFAGSGKSGSKDGAAAVAEFKDPQGLAYDRTRNILYVADSGNSRIRKIASDGMVTTLSASGLKKPAGLAIDAAGNLYIADTGHDVIRKLTSAGVMTIIAGTSNDNEDEADDGENENKYKDGPALQATFNAPLGLALSTNGALYVVDSKNDAVRKLEGGQVSTVAGGKAGGFADGPALTAKFKAPTGIAFDAAGNLLITDTKNQRIRKVTLGTSAAVSTIAGDGASGLVDGAPLSARFKDPSGIAFAATAVFIADSKNGVIRAILQELSQGPSVTGVTPAIVAAAGVEVRVTGSGFVSGQTTVRFGSTAASQVTFVSAGEVVATVPAMASARYDVVVTTPGGTATLANGFVLDAEAPAITASAAPAPNAAGWNNSNVRVTFACTDPLSGIATCTAPIDVAAEGAAQTVNGVAVDRAGNQKAIIVTVKLDKGLPVIAAVVTPAPNAAGWTNAGTTVRFDATDALSGIATVTPPVTVAAETAGQQIVGRAVDVAGNQAEKPVTVKLDLTAPAATATATPAPNAAGWNKDDVTVTFNGTDALSGIATTPPATVISTETASQSVTGSVTDAAGNSASAEATVKLDKTAPSATATATPAPNAAGWNKDDVTVTFSGTDALSGVDAIDPPKTVAGDGSQEVNGNVTDVAGNTAVASVTVNVDKSNPTITPAFAPAPNAAGWNNSDVTVTFTAIDAVSGIATSTAPVVVSSEGTAIPVPGTATDKAGNTGTATATVSLDKTAPVITASVIPAPHQAPSPSGWVRPGASVRFLCSDALSGLDACAPDVSITDEGRDQQATGMVIDRAGNTATATILVNADRTPPELTLTAVPAAVKEATITLQATVSDALSGVRSVTCNEAPATINGNAVTCTAGLLEGQNTVLVTAIDAAGNQTTLFPSIVRDSVPPVLTVEKPNGNQTTNGAAIEVRATANDDNEIASLKVNGVVVTSPDGNYSTMVALSEGSNTITVVATDRADNSSTLSTIVTRFTVPAVAITSPADLAVLTGSTTSVSGTLSDPSASVTVNGIPASVAGTTFHADGVALWQGRTVITAVATDPAGHLASASLNVYRDAIPPRLIVHTPSDNATVYASPISITGMVDDIVVGTINPSQVQVTVNGVDAEVRNRAYVARDIALTPGLNTLTVRAVDQGGNVVTINHRLTLASATGQPQIISVSGGAQSAVIGQTLAAPLVVRLTDAAGAPAVDKTVVFSVKTNNGTLVHGSALGRRIEVQTNAQGQASANWTIGMRAGAGLNRVEARATGYTGSASFEATGLVGSPALLVVDSGSGQFAATGGVASRPLVAVAVDAGSNRVPGVPVTFNVGEGGGSFGGQTTVTVTTDSDGRAWVTPTIGAEAGNDNNVFVAALAQLGDIGVPFFLSGRAAGPAAQTRIIGVILDNSDLPVPGVSVRIEGTTLTAQADAQGQFVLADVPVGYVKLFIDGSTSQRPGAWPMLEFAMYTVPGIDNTIGMPVYLLPIDTVRAITVSETLGGTLTLPELPGFSLTVAPGAATFPSGARTGTVSVTLVHADKMPMAPGFGQQPRFIVTIQPPGVHFDPPAAITFPNTDGLKPGEITEMYSFDHDLGQFIAIGTGSVSDDGSIIRSDPGIGIIKAGWHCSGNPAGSGAAGVCKKNGVIDTCLKCNTATWTCKGDPAKQNLQCQGHACKKCMGDFGCTASSTPAQAFNVSATSLEIKPASFSLPTDAYGAIGLEHLTVTFTARCAGANWKFVVLTMIGGYSKQTRLKPGQSEPVTPTQANFCRQVVSLRTEGTRDSANQAAPVGPFMMITAVDAHEEVHKSRLLPSLQAAAPAIETLLEQLYIPINDATTVGGAVAKFNTHPAMLPTLIQARDTIWIPQWNSYEPADHARPSPPLPLGDAVRAGVDILQARANQICAQAAGNVWGTCTWSPGGPSPPINMCP